MLFWYFIVLPEQFQGITIEIDTNEIAITKYLYNIHCLFI